MLRGSGLVPVSRQVRIAAFAPPRESLPRERFATGWPSTSTSLYTIPAVGAPEPVTTEVPTPKPSTGSLRRPAMTNSSRSEETTILVL